MKISYNKMSELLAKELLEQIMNDIEQYNQKHNTELLSINETLDILNNNNKTLVQSNHEYDKLVSDKQRQEARKGKDINISLSDYHESIKIIPTYTDDQFKVPWTKLDKGKKHYKLIMYVNDLKNKYNLSDYECAYLRGLLLENRKLNIQYNEQDGHIIDIPQLVFDIETRKFHYVDNIAKINLVPWDKCTNIITKPKLSTNSVMNSSDGAKGPLAGPIKDPIKISPVIIVKK